MAIMAVQMAAIFYGGAALTFRLQVKNT